MIWRKEHETWKAFGTEILGTTGLASVWSESTSTSGPSEPLASLTRPLNRTAAWDLTVKRPFYRPARRRGGSTKLAQLWLAAKALTETNYQRLYEELCCTRLPPLRANGRNAGLAMTWLRVKRLDKGGRGSSNHTKGVWLPKWRYYGVAIQYGDRK